MVADSTTFSYQTNTTPHPISCHTCHTHISTGVTCHPKSLQRSTVPCCAAIGSTATCDSTSRLITLRTAVAMAKCMLLLVGLCL